MATNNLQAGDVVTFAIKVNGNALPDELSILSVTVEKKVNGITKAAIIIADGDPATGTFNASSSPVFVPGALIAIEAGYDNSNKVIFKGIITGQNLRINDTTGPVLEVICYDAAIKMTVGRKNTAYNDKTDGEIISSLIQSYAGLSANIAATAKAWPAQVQYDVSDWDYMLVLAEANGLTVTTINGVVSVAAPTNNTAPVCSIIYGDGLLEFNASLNAVDQLGNVKASAWDYISQEVNSGQVTPMLSNSPGNLSTKKLSEVIGLDTFNLQTTAPLDTEDLTSWSKAQMLRSEFSKITGQAKFLGTNLIEPANYITLGGLGDRFSGDHFISGVTHTIAEGNWFTEVSIGMPATWFTRQTDIITPPAAGLLPAARGLLNGTVKQTGDDPQGQYRILVDIPVLNSCDAGIWARLSNFYASNGAGAFFLPEAGDEVLVGFLNEDPRFPVILGSMYSSKAHKPYQGIDSSNENRIKAIVSRSGISIEFDEMDKTLTICTPAKNSIVFSDKDKQVLVNDENGNSLLLNTAGISINSPKDIHISSGQRVNIQGAQGVNITSSGGDVALTGINIQETAQVQYSVAASAMANIQAGGELSLKGAIIMIN